MKELLKNPANTNRTDESGRQGEKRVRKLIRPVVAIVVATALLLSVSAVVLAATAANPNKKVKLTLSAEGQSRFACIRKNDTVTLTANVSDFTTSTFKDGLYGCTLDIVYDSGVFGYVADSARLETADENFTVRANPNVNSNDESVVSVLFFADDAEGALSYIDEESGLFSLDFEVIGNVSDDFDFTPFDCKLADKKDIGNDFELVTLNPAPQALNVALKAILTGDINGDDSVTVTDLVLIKKHIVNAAGLTGGAFLAADADGSGVLAAADITWMRREILNLN